MNTRLSDPAAFHGEGAIVDWTAVVRRMISAGQPGAEGPISDTAAKAGRQVQLRWSVASSLGLSPGPFTVWTRPVADRTTPVDYFVYAAQVAGIDGQQVWCPGPAMAHLAISVTVDDPSRSVSAFAFAAGNLEVEGLVAAASQPAGATNAVLELRAGAMNAVLVVNGTVTSVSAESLPTAVNDPSWTPVERVGLPVASNGWPGTVYDCSDQGLTATPADPVTAATDRLKRGAPPFGWWPSTAAGHPAPAWEAPDPARFVSEVGSLMFPAVAPLFAAGVLPSAQAALTATSSVTPPTQDGRTVANTSTSSYPPLGVLQLAAGTDPFSALALGFGTAYPLAAMGLGPVTNRVPPRTDVDYLVTADYPAGVGEVGALGMATTYAAFIPSPGSHLTAIPVSGLSAALAGLVGPPARDAAWRETVRLTWDRVQPTAALGRLAGYGLCTYPGTAGSAATPLLDQHASGGYRTIAPTPRPIPQQQDAFYPVLDWSAQAEDIPLGSGGRHVGYAIAGQDPYGIWSPWADVAWDGHEPGPSVPQVVSARLQPVYAGSPVCATTMEVHLAVDWTNRTPRQITLRGVLVPLADVGDPLPPGVTALGPPPAGATRHDTVIGVDGDALDLTLPSDQVAYLDEEAQTVVGPHVPSADPTGQHGMNATRHYRLRLPLDVDFSTVDHYVLALWADEVDTVASGAPALSPVTARMSTPVPLVVAYTAPPVVPLASAPDARGVSHGSIAFGPFPSARTVTVWACPEHRILPAASAATMPAPTLTERYQSLLSTYDALPPDQQRLCFRHEVQVPGTATEAGVELPPGSDEILLYAVTATNAGHVESAWPTASSSLHAFARPRLVAPAAPEVMAVDGGAGGASVTVTVGGSVAPSQVQVFRTRLDTAATSVDQMGPPVGTVTAFTFSAVSTDPTQGADPTNNRWTGTLADTPGPSWRSAWYRAVAWAADDPANGVVGIRSRDSAPFPLMVTPSGPPDVTVPVSSFWGSDRDGILATWDTDAPPQASRFGVSTVRVRVTRDAAPQDPPLVDLVSTLDALVVDAGAAPPVSVTGGVLLRGLRASDRTPMHLWLRRSTPDDVLTLTVTVTDPLGRGTTVSSSVPAVPPDPPPEVILGVPQSLPGGSWAPFSSQVPVVAVLDGVYTFDVYVGHPLVLRPPVHWPPEHADPGHLPPFQRPAVHLPPAVRPPLDLPPVLRPAPPLHLRVAVPDTPVVAGRAEVPAGTTIGVFRMQGTSDPAQYLVVAALSMPATVRIVVTAPDGRTSEAASTA